MPVVNEDNHRTIDCDELARVVKFSPFELSSDLLAFGTSSKIVVINCLAPEEKSSLVDVVFETLAEVHYGTSVIDISWSPQTNLHTIPRSIKLFAVGSDRKVRYLTSDLRDSTTLTVVGEHKNYINAVASHPETGDCVASVSDDHTCCIWSVDGDAAADVVSFPLTSPGMAVCFHPQEPSKIMVAEKNGVIRFYSILTRRAFMSLDCSQVPLLSADWCLANSLRVAALAGSDWFVFDTSHSRLIYDVMDETSAGLRDSELVSPVRYWCKKTGCPAFIVIGSGSLPLETRIAHSVGGQAIRWSLSHDHLFATTGRPGSTLKVFNLKTNQVILSVEKKLISGLSWHARQPIIAIGGDAAVHLYIVDVL